MTLSTLMEYTVDYLYWTSRVKWTHVCHMIIVTLFDLVSNI